MCDKIQFLSKFNTVATEFRTLPQVCTMYSDVTPRFPHSAWAVIATGTPGIERTRFGALACEARCITVEKAKWTPLKLSHDPLLSAGPFNSRAPQGGCY